MKQKKKNGGRGGCGGVNEPRDTVWNCAIGMAKERGERVENDDEIDNNE